MMVGSQRTRFLCFSDIHLDASTAGMRRIDDLDRALGHVVELAVVNKVQAAVCLGDISDPDAGSVLVRVYDALFKLVARLSAMGIDSMFVAGNHDVVEDGSGSTILTPLWHATGARVFERPTCIEYRGCELGFLPFTSRVNQYDPVEVLKAFYTKGSRRRALLGHCTSVLGVKSGSESGELARGGSLRFPVEEAKKIGVELMVNGHFHYGQVTPDGVHIPGSLERLRFDEEHHQPGVLICDL